MSISLKMLLAGFCLISTGVLAQPIYRVVDENGNVTYTDQKPAEDAEPLDLPDINVISENDPEVEELIEPEPADGAVEPLQLTIAEPAEDAVIANSDGRIDIRLDSNLDIPPAAQMVVYLNDQPQPPIRSLELTLSDLSPGEYRLRAELQTPSGRVLAETESVSVRLIAAEPR